MFHLFVKNLLNSSLVLDSAPLLQHEFRNFAYPSMLLRLQKRLEHFKNPRDKNHLVTFYPPYRGIKKGNGKLIKLL